MHLLKSLQIVLLVLVCRARNVSCHKSFVIPFQPLIDSSFSPSTDEWIEFTNDIPHSKEFTACHWIRTKYFNKHTAFVLWSYCTIESVDGAMECIQIDLNDALKSANRDVTMKASKIKC